MRFDWRTFTPKFWTTLEREQPRPYRAIREVVEAVTAAFRTIAADLAGLAGRVSALENRSTSFKAYMASGQSFGAGSWAKVAFDTVEYDETGVYDATLYRYTAKQRETVVLTVAVGMPAGVAGTRRTQIQIYKNGSAAEQIADASNTASSTSLHQRTGTALMRMEPGDYLEVQFRCDSAVTTTFNANVTYLKVERIR